MHSLGLAHGDVKPANVMLREHEHRGANLVILDVAVRSSWRSPLYLAPEGFEMRGMTPAEDVYALGLFLYEMLAGAHPFGACAGDIIAIARAQIRTESAPIREIASTFAPELAAIVERMIVKDPAKRYATGADEFGRRPRRPESLAYIAAILAEFQIISIVELRDDLTHLRAVLDLVGPRWRAVFTAPTFDQRESRTRRVRVRHAVRPWRGGGEDAL